jgi:hypothetical protein
MPLSPTPPNGREWTVKCMMVSFTMAPPEMVFLFCRWSLVEESD